MARVALGTLIAAMMLVGSASAQEATPHVSLRWNAPDECPDDAEATHAVESFLGEPLAEAHEQNLSITANVSIEKAGFSAQLRFKGAAGVENRSLEHPECRKLMEAVALLVALAIDPERVKARQARVEDAEHPATAKPEPAPAIEAAPAPKQAPPLPVTPSPPEIRTSTPQQIPPRTRPTEPFSAQLEVFGLAASGVLPMIGPGLGTSIGLRRGRFELGLAGNYFLPRTDPVAGSPRADIQLSLWTLGPRACGLPLLGAWQLRACLGVEVGDLSGEGQGLEHARTIHARFSAFAASLTLRYGRQALGPIVGVEGGAPFERPPFGVSINGQQTQTFQPDRLNIRGIVGLAYRL